MADSKSFVLEMRQQARHRNPNSLAYGGCTNARKQQGHDRQDLRPQFWMTSKMHEQWIEEDGWKKKQCMKG